MDKVKYESLSLRPVVPEAGAEDYLLVLTEDGVRRLHSGRAAVETEDDTATVLDTFVLIDNSAVLITGVVVAINDSGLSKAWRYVVHAVRGANAAATALASSPDVEDLSVMAGTAGWLLEIDDNTTDGSVEFAVTGASEDIRWTNQKSFVTVA